MADIGKPPPPRRGRCAAACGQKPGTLPITGALSPRPARRAGDHRWSRRWRCCFRCCTANDADINSAANALAFAALALGLNIVVGFAGLLDLGYAAFFAIGAYAYGAAASFQLQPEWSGFWEPFRWLDLVARMPGRPAATSSISRCRSG